MANLTEKITATLFQQSTEMSDEITKHHPLLNILEKKNRKKMHRGGYEYRKVVMYNETFLGGAYTGYDTFDLQSQEDLEAFQFNVKSVFEPFSISGRDMRANAGKHELVDLVSQKYERTKIALKNNISQQILSDGTGYGGKAFDGVSKAVSTTPTTGTYGKIDRATNTWARNASNNITLSSANVQSTISLEITKISRNNEGPDCALAGRTAWGLLHDSLTGIQRINDESKKGSAGFRQLHFDGVDFFFDGGFGAANSGAGTVGTNTVRLLNTNYWSFDIEEQANFVPIADMDRPINQDAYYTIIIVEGNLCCSAPMLQSVIFP